MATAKQQPGKKLPMTKANNPAIIAKIENKLGPVGPGHHNSHRTAALLRWLNSKESGKKGDSGDGQSNPYGNTPPDNPNVDSNPNDWMPKGSKKSGVSPKGTPDKNLSPDKMDQFLDSPDRMPMFGLKSNKNGAAGSTPNIHLPAQWALSPREAKYYQYLKSQGASQEQLNAFINTVHDQNA